MRRNTSENLQGSILTLTKSNLRKLIEEEFGKLRKAKLNEFKQQQALKKMENRIKDLKSSSAGRMWRGVAEDLTELSYINASACMDLKLEYEKQKLLYELGLIDKKPNAFTFYLKNFLYVVGIYATVFFLIYLLIKWLISK